MVMNVAAPYWEWLCEEEGTVLLEAFADDTDDDSKSETVKEKGKDKESAPNTYFFIGLSDSVNSKKAKRASFLAETHPASENHSKLPYLPPESSRLIALV